MTPIWIFPAYPLLIVGPFAGNLAPKVTNPTHAFDILISGFIMQGVGFMVSLMIYSAFLYRLMTQKLPKENLRPGMFISVGPSGFTISGLISMGQYFPKVVPKDFMSPGMGELVGQVTLIMANWSGLWLWGLAIWFFMVSVGAHFSSAAHGKMTFAMTWYSFVFPNTALTTATFAVDRALDGIRPIQIIGCVMTVALVIMWFFVFGMMIRAVYTRQILWPHMQEDRNEGGWCHKCGGKAAVHKHKRPTPSRLTSAMNSMIWEVKELLKTQHPNNGCHDHHDMQVAMASGNDVRPKMPTSKTSRHVSEDWKTVAKKGQTRDSAPFRCGTAQHLHSEPEHETMMSGAAEEAVECNDSKETFSTDPNIGRIT